MVEPNDAALNAVEDQNSVEERRDIDIEDGDKED